MMRKRAVMMPVMLYRMIIATAVLGDFPTTSPLPLFCCWASLMVVDASGGELTVKAFSKIMDVLASGMV